MVHVKICGVMSAQDATLCVEAGASAIGLNFFEGSPRCLTPDAAQAIVDVVRGQVLAVGVFVDAVPGWVQQVKQTVGLDCVQFHGNESPETVAAFLPHAYRALRVRSEAVLQEAEQFPGSHILLDAYVPGVHGGSGATFDWELAARLARRRQVTLAGGLTPDNVGQAVQQVRPFAVDVASGVEVAPGVKSPELVRRFVAQAKAAAESFA